ncbi:MAG TPA: hypothetical protein VK277_01765 [Acidimicrobiales bacterium]|nr:hypothetical protein [Acidimicrobiales bacterium]
MTLVIHEVHRVRGKEAEAFEEAVRQYFEAAAALGAEPGWYFEVSHGTGPSYRVVTGLRLPAWAAWEAFAEGSAYGKLSAATEAVDACRYDSEARLFQVVAERADGAEELPGPALWVQRTVAEADAASLDHDGPERPEVVLRQVLGDSPPDTVTVLRREAPRDVLDLLTGTTPSPTAPSGQSTWVLRPSDWSPLR